MYNRVIAWLALLHSGLLVVFLLARAVMGSAAIDGVLPQWLERPYSLLVLINEFTVFLFLPLPLWVAGAALIRSRAAVVAAALACALFGLVYGELFVPRPAHIASLFGARGESATSVRVMTMNLMAYSRPLDGSIAEIDKAGPDILLVQELSESFARILEPALARVYPYSALRPGFGPLGEGIWSRYPIVSEELWDGSAREALWQHALVDVNGAPLEIVNLHLTAPSLLRQSLERASISLYTGEEVAARQAEVAWLMPRLRPLVASSDAVIVAGDLNLTDQDPEFAEIRSAGLTDAARAVGWGFSNTFPSSGGFRLFHQRVSVPFPFLALDHVFVGGAAQPISSSVWPDSGGSDHLPLLVEVHINGAAVDARPATESNSEARARP